MSQSLIVNARFLSQPLTGVQRYAQELSRYLKKLSPAIHWVSPPQISRPEVARELQAATIGKFTGHLWEQTSLPIYLRRNGRPLLLNLANTAPLYYVPQVVTIHDLAALKYPPWFSRSFSAYYRFLIPRIARNARHIFTVSQFSRSEIVTSLRVPEEKVSVVHNAVSETFSFADAPVSGSPYGNFILAVSSLEPRKNLSRVLQAFQLLEDRELRLVIIGARFPIYARERHTIPEAVAERVLWLGTVDDATLAHLYHTAQLLVYPSLYEGFGLPPLEAMACGCPAVVSQAASLPEVCGDAAYYVDPFQPEDIARGIMEVLADSRLKQTLREKGRERVRLFSWRRSAEKVLKMIAQLERR